MYTFQKTHLLCYEAHNRYVSEIPLTSMKYFYLHIFILYINPNFLVIADNSNKSGTEEQLK